MRWRKRQYCPHGPCAGLAGHKGSCEEASGWDKLYGRHSEDWFVDGGLPFITVDHLRLRDDATFKAAVARLRAVSA